MPTEVNLTDRSFKFQTLPLSLFQVLVPRRAGRDEQLVGQHQRLLRAHHGDDERVGQRQVLSIKFWSKSQ